MNIQKKKNREGVGLGRGVRVDVNEELKFFYETSKKIGGGGGLGGGSG